MAVLDFPSAVRVQRAGSASVGKRRRYFGAEDVRGRKRRSTEAFGASRARDPPRASTRGGERETNAGFNSRAPPEFLPAPSITSKTLKAVSRSTQSGSTIVRPFIDAISITMMMIVMTFMQCRTRVFGQKENCPVRNVLRTFGRSVEILSPATVRPRRGIPV